MEQSWQKYRQYGQRVPHARKFRNKFRYGLNVSFLAIICNTKNINMYVNLHWHEAYCVMKLTWPWRCT